MNKSTIYLLKFFNEIFLPLRYYLSVIIITCQLLPTVCYGMESLPDDNKFTESCTECLSQSYSCQHLPEVLSKF